LTGFQQAEIFMKKQTDQLDGGTFEAIRTFAGEAKAGEVASMREAFKRQADLFRRNGDDGRAAFWDALANRIAKAADPSDRQAGEAKASSPATAWIYKPATR
jgi:hypothetical protein